jgi:hypothetical protein
MHCCRQLNFHLTLVGLRGVEKCSISHLILELNSNLFDI